MARKLSKTAPCLKLADTLDIQHAVERLAELAIPAEPAGAPFAVDLSAVTSCDTAGLQLLCSARRSATLKGREWRPQKPSAAVLRACSEVGIQPEQLGL